MFDEPIKHMGAAIVSAIIIAIIITVAVIVGNVFEKSVVGTPDANGNYSGGIIQQIESQAQSYIETPTTP